MSDTDKAATLRAIIAETQRLRTNALRDGLDSVALRCEEAMHEARAQLAELGLSPEPDPTLTDDPKVVRFRQP
jgi:hypothetical protein